MLVCSFLFSICTRDRGCSAHPVFPAPSLEGRLRPSWDRLRPHFCGPMNLQNSGAACRENADLYPDVIVRLDRATQYSRALMMETKSRGVLDPPVLVRNCARGRGMTAVCGARQRRAV